MMRAVLLSMVATAAAQAPLGASTPSNKSGLGLSGIMGKYHTWASNHTPPKPGFPGMTPIAKGSADAMEMGKLREAMLTWYCEPSRGHADTRPGPCITFKFMQSMRATKDPAAKKQLLTDRQATLKGRTPEQAKAAGVAARAGYKDMFGSFCAANKDHAACSHPLLNKLHGAVPGAQKELGGR